MLHEFLTSNRETLISRCLENVNRRVGTTDAPQNITYGVSLFLEQIVETLRLEQKTMARSGDESEVTPAPTAIGRAAALHGSELLQRGFSVDQVVHDYGDVCQCVTALAVERGVYIAPDEFRTFNRCIDNAIAEAVVSFEAAREIVICREVSTLQRNLAAFGDEHRRLVEIATQSLTAIRTGNIGIGGATGTLLAHALTELGALAERTLPELRLAFELSTPVASD